MLNNISFTSNIRPVTIPQYKYEISTYDNPRIVDRPWTYKESKLADNVITTNIADCTVCGIKVKDKMFLLHTSPLQDTNKDFNRIEQFIKENIDLKSNATQAILIGGKPSYTHGPESYALFEKYEALLNKYNIPYTKLKGGMGLKHVGYSSKKDEWIIAHKEIAPLQERMRTTPIQELNKIFNEVSICEKDKTSWLA